MLLPSQLFSASPSFFVSFREASASVGSPVVFGSSAKLAVAVDFPML